MKGYQPPDRNAAHFTWAQLLYEGPRGWLTVLCSGQCGSYYSDSPCHAQSCDSRHPYCAVCIRS